MTISKEKLRLAALMKRDAMPVADRAAKSLSICRSLELMASKEFNNRGNSFKPIIAVYSKLRSEVDLGHFIAYCYSQGWDVCFPAMTKGNFHDAKNEFLHAYAADATAPNGAEMIFVHVPKSQMKPDEVEFMHHPARAIPVEELKAQGWVAVAPAQVNMVVVPMVAFDGDNHRLGYGGGNYDRFLAKTENGTLVVGAAYKDQEVNEVPTEDHDIALPEIVTD